MPKIYSQGPYYEYYNALDNYVKMLAIPERAAQSVEWNMLQTMLLDFIKRIGDSIFRDGNVVEGCTIRIEDNLVHIGPGKIYMDGIVRETEGGVVSIEGTGDEVIGVKIVEDIVTEVDDLQFLDPATGSSNHLHPGCYRVRQTLVFTVNDDQAATLLGLKDGDIQNLVEEKPQMDVMTDVLARRTFDESGNYVVKGFSLKTTGHHDEDTILVGLEKGKAYVKGYEVQRPADTTFKVNKSKTFSSVTGEPKVVSTLNNTYTLINNPVKEVSKVFATVKAVETVNRGSVAGTTDALVNSPVVEILSITQSTTTYTPGVDFVLTNNKVDWSPSGKEPATGSNYIVTYTYKLVLNEGADYVVSQSDTYTTITVTNSYLVPNTELLIDYDFYLARKDTICIDKNGVIQVSEGQPAPLVNARPPVIEDNSILKLGVVAVMPNSSDIIPITNTVKVSTMEKIQNTIKRVDDLEYNIAITDLDAEAMQGEDTTSLKGIFTEGFLNYNKVDMGISDVAFSLDPTLGYLLLPFTENMSILTPQGSSGYATIGNVLSCPYREVIAISQPLASEGMLVNPYQVFSPTMSMSINPQVDTWVESSTVTVENVNTTTTTLKRWWMHSGESWAAEEKKLWEAMGFAGGLANTDDSYSQGEANRWLGYASNQHQTGSSYETILDEATLYMRQREVTVSSETFPLNENNIKLKFNGVDVPLIPLNQTGVGSLEGSVKAKNGIVEAKFVVPSGVPCGTAEVILYSPNYEARTQYQANGRKTVTQETIFIEKREVWATDPLAQTFQFRETYNITSMDLYFAESDGEIPAKVQIRNVVNGYPGAICYSEVTIKGSNIKTSANGSIPTHVVFPNVVKCEADTQYCVVIMTDSSKMKHYVAKLGDRDLIGGQYITSNPYISGTLFSSSNAITWTAHQDYDLKFNLYRAEYTGEASITFNTVALNSVDRFMVCLDSVTPANCSAKMEVSINSGAWEPWSPWEDRELSTVANRADIRVTLVPTNGQSPLISKDTGLSVSWRNEKDLTYVSRNINIPEGFNNIKVYFDRALVAGGSYKAYYSLDSTGSTWVELKDPVVKALNEEWEQVFYEKDLDNVNYNYRIKIVAETLINTKRVKVKRLMNILKIID